MCNEVQEMLALYNEVAGANRVHLWYLGGGGGGGGGGAYRKVWIFRLSEIIPDAISGYNRVGRPAASYNI